MNTENKKKMNELHNFVHNQFPRLDFKSSNNLVALQNLYPFIACNWKKSINIIKK